MSSPEPPLNPPNIRWDEESWEAYQKAKEEREEKEFREGWDGVYKE